MADVIILDTGAFIDLGHAGDAGYQVLERFQAEGYEIITTDAVIGEIEQRGRIPNFPLLLRWHA